MAIMDIIERNIILPCSRERAWVALTTAKGLSNWFGPDVDLEFKVGGKFNMRWSNGDRTTGQVEAIDAPNKFAYRWYADDTDNSKPMQTDNSTLVTFTLEDNAEGTQLTVVETGFAGLPAKAREKVHKENTHGWQVELGELLAYLQPQEA